MYLETKSERLAIAQMGPDFIILRKPTEFQPGYGELVVQIDGDEQRRAIYLPDGAHSTDERIRLVRG
jgi:hypothetical protein